MLRFEHNVKYNVDGTCCQLIMQTFIMKLPTTDAVIYQTLSLVFDILHHITLMKGLSRNVCDYKTI